jgi:hypothetical protein
LEMKPGEASQPVGPIAPRPTSRLRASPVYEPLSELAHQGFTGTVAELRARLDSMVSDGMRRSIRWPKSPNALGNALRRVTTRPMVSVVAAQIRKTPSVAVSDRQ